MQWIAHIALCQVITVVIHSHIKCFILVGVALFLLHILRNESCRVD